MKSQVPNLTKTQDIFIDNKNNILSQWLSYDSPQKILNLHDIDKSYFLKEPPLTKILHYVY